MWPFKRSRSRSEPDGEWWDRLLKVESAQRALELEWENTFEKIKRAMAKLGKRAKAIEAEETTVDPEQLDIMSDAQQRGRILAAWRARQHNGGG